MSWLVYEEDAAGKLVLVDEDDDWYSALVKADACNGFVIEAKDD